MRKFLTKTTKDTEMDFDFSSDFDDSSILTSLSSCPSCEILSTTTAEAP